MSRYPHLVALRARQREAHEEISRSRVRRKEPQDPRVLLQRAVGFAERGAFGEALECFEELLAKVPDNVHAHCAHARLLQTLGDHAGARTALLSALMVRPEHGEALGILGRSLLELGDFEQARECFDRALRLAPKNAEVHYDLGRTLLKEERFEDALNRLERATQLDPGLARAWAELGRCLEQLGHGSEALECLERARQLAPSDHAVARAWGRCLLAQGATDLPTRFRELWPDSSTLCVGLELTSTLLAEQDRSDELHDLLGFDSFVETYELDRVEGYDSVQQFNEALVATADSHSELRRAEGVHRSGNLLARCSVATGDIAQVVADATTDYLAKLPRGSHPFVRHRPMQTELDARALRMPPRGREIATGQASWLSGIYYAEVASGVTEFSIVDSQGRQCATPRLVCRPRPGTLVLYPSFLHRWSRVDAEANGMVAIDLMIMARTGTTGARYAPR